MVHDKAYPKHPTLTIAAECTFTQLQGFQQLKIGPWQHTQTKQRPVHTCPVSNIAGVCSRTTSHVSVRTASGVHHLSTTLDSLSVLFQRTRRKYSGTPAKNVLSPPAADSAGKLGVHVQGKVTSEVQVWHTRRWVPFWADCGLIDFHSLSRGAFTKGLLHTVIVQKSSMLSYISKLATYNPAYYTAPPSGKCNANEL